MYAGTFGPALVAVLLTGSSSDRGALRHLVSGIGKFPDRASYYVFAVGYMLTVKMIAALVQYVITGVWAAHHAFPELLFPLAVAISTPVQAGEELGWRGFLLPRLATEMGFGNASLIVGVVWAAWHLPLFFIPGVDIYRESFPLFALAVIPLSVTMAWLYASTNGSVLLTMLMHSAVNQTTIFFSASSTAAGVWQAHTSMFGWTTILLLWIVAALFYRRLERGDFLAVTGAEYGTDRATVASSRRTWT